MKRALRIVLVTPIAIFWMLLTLIVYPFIRFAYWIDDDPWPGGYRGFALAMFEGLNKP